MGGNSSADILQCQSGLDLHALVLFVNTSALISGGKVCCLFEPGVRIDSTHVDGSQQALIAERHPHILTGEILCTLCVHYLKPSRIENITKNNIACNTRITCPINRRCCSCQEQI